MSAPKKDKRLGSQDYHNASIISMKAKLNEQDSS
jgi:hypothetical protein